MGSLLWENCSEKVIGVGEGDKGVAMNQSRGGKQLTISRQVGENAKAARGGVKKNKGTASGARKMGLWGLNKGGREKSRQGTEGGGLGMEAGAEEKRGAKKPNGRGNMYKKSRCYHKMNRQARIKPIGKNWGGGKGPSKGKKVKMANQHGVQKGVTAPGTS